MGSGLKYRPPRIILTLFPDPGIISPTRSSDGSSSYYTWALLLYSFAGVTKVPLEAAMNMAYPWKLKGQWCACTVLNGTVWNLVERRFSGSKMKVSIISGGLHSGGGAFIKR